MPNKIKRRRTKAEIEELKKKIYEILENFHPESTRQAFYQMSNAGCIPKTEAAYQGVAALWSDARGRRTALGLDYGLDTLDAEAALLLFP